MNDDIQNIENIWKILHSYEAEIFGYIKHSVGSADIARDIYQDVYLQALQNIHQLDIERSLKNWLMTVARNRVINYFREKKRRQYIEYTDGLQRFEPEMEEEYYGYVREALKYLPDSQKDIFIARELDGLSYDELAEKTGLSKSAVTSLLDRSRKNFAKSLLLNMMPDWLKKNAKNLSLEDLNRFVDSYDSLDVLLSKIEKQSQRYFARINDEWNELRRGFINTNQLSRVFHKLGDQKEKITLDLGSGTGFISLHCALSGSQVFAVDMNKKMLFSQVKSKSGLGLQNLNLIQADITRLPFMNKKFDQIFLTLVLHHISDPFDMLTNVVGKLNSGGKLILIDFLRHQDKPFADQMHDLWLGFEIDKINKWLKKSGLRLIDSEKWPTKSGINVFCQIYGKLL